jgi:lipopolysaccharide heptosyltransferase II
VKEVKKILIYRIGNLGDTVCAMPAMAAVRRRFPNAWIGLLTNKEEGNNPDSQKILKGNDFLNEIITYKPERLREIKYLWDLLKRLHKLQIDLLVYLALSKSTRQRLVRDWLFFRLSGCRKLIGLRIPKPAKILVDNGRRLPVYPQEVDRLMSLLVPLGINPSIIDFRLPIKEKDKETVNVIWNDYQLKTKNPIVAICPGAKFHAKRWSILHFAEVISELQKQFDAKILLIGGPSEKVSGDEIIKTTGGSVVNLVEKTNYMQSAEVFSRCNLLVSNDCGPVHLAAAVGTPVVGIYSSRDFPGAWHPWGENNTVLRNDSVSCRFCFKTECETMECINSISVDQVIAACRDYLK